MRRAILPSAGARRAAIRARGALVARSAPGAAVGERRGGRRGSHGYSGLACCGGVGDAARSDAGESGVGGVGGPLSP